MGEEPEPLHGPGHVYMHRTRLTAPTAVGAQPGGDVNQEILARSPFESGDEFGRGYVHGEDDRTHLTTGATLGAGPYIDAPQSEQLLGDGDLQRPPGSCRR